MFINFGNLTFLNVKLQNRMAVQKNLDKNKTLSLNTPSMFESGFGVSIIP